jgi:hypothetical protein
VNPFRNNFIYLLYSANLFFLATIYYLDASTIVNLGSNLIITYSAYTVSSDLWKSSLSAPNAWSELKISLEICLILAFFVSILVTAAGVQNAPDGFPWQQIADSKRLLLIDGNVGQSVNVYIEGILLSIYIYDFTTSKRKKLPASKILLMLLLLVLSKSRIAYFFMLPITFLLIGKIRYLPFLRSPAKLLFLLLPIIFICGSLNSSVEPFIETIANSAQSLSGNLLRITNINQISSDPYDFSSGRNALNEGLFTYAGQRPLFGLGRDAPILTLGVDQHGGIAAPGNAVSHGESPLRIAVEYGWPFFILTTALLSYPLLLLRSTRDKSLRDLLFSLIYIVICTFFFEGEFDIFYGTNAVLLLLVFYVGRIAENAKYSGLHMQLQVVRPASTASR